MTGDDYRRAASFVRRVRHDANNPLTAALGNVQLLLEDAERLDPETLETLQTVESELRRLMSVLRRLGELHPDMPPPQLESDAQT